MSFFLDPPEGFGWIFGVYELYTPTQNYFPPWTVFLNVSHTPFNFFVYLYFYIFGFAYHTLEPPPQWTPHLTMAPSHPSYIPIFVFNIFFYKFRAQRALVYSLSIGVWKDLWSR